MDLPRLVRFGQQHASYAARLFGKQPPQGARFWVGVCAAATFDIKALGAEQAVPCRIEIANMPLAAKVGDSRRDRGTENENGRACRCGDLNVEQPECDLWRYLLRQITKSVSGFFTPGERM